MLISCVVTAQLIDIFVLAFVKCCFSNNAAAVLRERATSCYKCLDKFISLCPPSEGVGGHIVFGVDPVGVGGVAFCLHNIS